MRTKVLCHFTVEAATERTFVMMARAEASRQGLDPVLVCAVCEQESNWNPRATRYEPGFMARYIVPMRLQSVEAQGRATSWGLMQIMGEVAREFGFQGDFDALLYPQTGLYWGCKVLAHKLTIAHGDIDRALLLWNGGGRPAYVTEVLARLPKYGGMNVQTA